MQRTATFTKTQPSPRGGNSCSYFASEACVVARRRPWWKAQANRIHDLVIAHQWISYVPVETVERWAPFEGKGVIVREDLNRSWYGHELRIMI